MRWVKGAVQHLPAARALGYIWNIGSLLGAALLLQVTTGVLLTFFYSGGEEVFHLVNSISREAILPFRWVHLNGASLFFLFLYVHMFRGILFCSFRIIKVWLSGLVIFLLGVVIAFMGYVLPWGQMSFWAATVITGLLSVLPHGAEIVTLILGGFLVNVMTLNFFYSMHFLLPLVLLAIVVVHLQFLHEFGSSSKLVVVAGSNKAHFHPFFTLKDAGGGVVLLLAAVLVIIIPYLRTDHENFVEANPLMSPLEIKPEWYFLWLYAILRSVPNKVGGVLAMFSAVIVLGAISMKRSKHTRFSYLKAAIVFYLFLTLRWVGGCPIEPPFLALGQGRILLFFLLLTFLCLNSCYSATLKLLSS